MAKEMGLGVIPWSPLGSGVLSGKYSAEDLRAPDGEGNATGSRKRTVVEKGFLSPRTLRVAEVVKAVANDLGRTPAQVALAWTLLNPGVVSSIVGARTQRQLADNLEALSVKLELGHCERLNAASA